MENIRLTSLHIDSFRGVAGPLQIEFTRPSQPASSMIIFGSNGSGKSSIVDAVEFALTGKIGSMQRLSTRVYPRATSFASNREASVQMQFSDGSTISRWSATDEHGGIKCDPVDEATIGRAFILRRADILRFYDTSSLQRLVLLQNYLPKSKGTKNITELVDETDLELVSNRDRIQSVRQELSMLLGHDLAGYHKEQIGRIIHEKLFGNMPIKQRRRLQSTGFSLKPNNFPQAKAESVRKLQRELELLTTQRAEIKKDRRQPFRTVAEPQFVELQDILNSISPALAVAFINISGADFIKSIKLRIAKEGMASLRVVVQFKNGARCGPQEIFSEANLDLLALLIYLYIAKAVLELQSFRLLVLDDVLQSVDSIHRVRTTEHILREFQGWQFLVTAHDRLWLEQLRQIFASCRTDAIVRTLDSWSFEIGPVIKGAPRSAVQELQWIIDNADQFTIAAKASQVLEQVAQELSWTLPVKVDRRRDDRYELGVLWPRIFSILSSSSISDTISGVNTWVSLRNIVGAHYNEWALSAEKNDIISFANAVSQLLQAVYCGACGLVSKIGDKDYSCRCGTTRFHVVR